MQIVNKRTFIFEKIYHANPSGIDNTVITHGGFMIYNKVTGMKFIKSNFLNQFFDLYIINTKIIKNSKVAIETVRKIYESKSEAKDYINKIGEITDKILEIITEDTSELNNLKGMENFRNLIQENQRLLSLFDLSNGKIDLLLE